MRGGYKCFEVRVLEEFFLQHAGSVYFFNPRFLFNQKERNPGKGHFISLLKKRKFLYVQRRISSEIKGCRGCLTSAVV